MEIQAIKDEIQDFLYRKLTPYQVFGSYEIPLSDGVTNYDLGQCFKPFSTCFRPRKDSVPTGIYEMPVYLKAIKYGTPDSGVKVSLQASNSSNLPDGTEIAAFTIHPSEVYGSATVLTKKFAMVDYLEESKETYWLVISPLHSISSSNYFSFYRHNTNSEYILGSLYRRETGSSWVPQNVDLYFRISTPGWIYTDYPKGALSLAHYPRLTVDVHGGAPVMKWISQKIVEYRPTLRLTGFSQDLDELDEILGKASRLLFDHRVNYFSNFLEYLPGELSPPVPVRQTLISRVLTAKLRLQER